MISVVIPLYNDQDNITKALDSVFAQTVGASCFEVIVVDDGSTDASCEVVQKYIQKHPSYNIQLICQENGGVANARNTAIKLSTGVYIALLDSDDEWLPNKIERQLAYLQNKNLNIDFIATRRNNAPILFPYQVKNHLAKISFRKLLIRNETQPSTVMFKRSVLDKTGLFNNDQRYVEDVNYWLKISRTSSMYILDENLVIAGGGKRSFGVSGLSANLRAMREGYDRNLKEMHRLGYLNGAELFFLRLFYQSKYLLLLLRSMGK